MANKALFLDRDGTINVDHGYVHKISDFEFIKGIFSFCKKSTDLGYKIIVITNQSGISRGMFSMDEMEKVHTYMKQEFSKKGVPITDIFVCPSKDDTDPDRKPNIGLLLKAKEKYDIDMKNSIMVGDKERDIMAGLRSGCGHNYLFSPNKKQKTQADGIYDNFEQMKEVLA